MAHGAPILSGHLTNFARAFVWLGGALFAAALAATTYTYLIIWATPRVPALDPRAILADVALLTVFAGHHSVFARERTKQWMAEAVPQRLQRSLYVWLASTLLLVAIAFWQPAGGDVYFLHGWLALAHAAVQLSGMALIAGSVARIDALELAGIRAATEQGAPSLETTGPYRWVSHPLYLGWVLAVFGAAHMTADRLTFAVITTAYLVVAVPWEERSLTRAFGEAYTRYAARVRWRIVPYIY